MPVMVQLKNTNLVKTFSIITILVSVILLSGCNIVDNLTPNVNRDDMLKVDPGTLLYSFQDTTDREDDNDSNSGSGAGSIQNSVNTDKNNFVNKNGNIVINADNFEEFKYKTVGASMYSVYLEKEIVKPIVELLNTVSDDNKNKIYFRVFHLGYNYDSDKGAAETAAPFNYNYISSVSYLYGKSLKEYCIDWLSKSPINDKIIENSKSTVLHKLDLFLNSREGTDNGFSWDSVDVLRLSAISDFPRDIFNIMNSDMIDVNNIASYRAAVQNDNPTNTIPNLSMYYYVSPTKRQHITLNETSSYKSEMFIDRISMNNVNKLFTSYNQFPTRECDNMIKVYKDPSTYIYSYLDGYNRTFIVLASSYDVTLPDVLGDLSVNKIYDILGGIKNVKQWKEISKYVDLSAVNLIEEGIRGVN